MDEEYEGRPFDAPLLKAKPSEYMACGCSCAASRTKRACVMCRNTSQPKISYSHWDSHTLMRSTLADHSDLPNSLKRRIFCDNPLRFYGTEADFARFGAGH